MVKKQQQRGLCRRVYLFGTKNSNNVKNRNFKLDQFSIQFSLIQIEFTSISTQSNSNESKSISFQVKKNKNTVIKMTNIKCLLNSSVFICMFFHLTELELRRSELRGRCVSLQTTPSFTHSSQSLVHTYHSLLWEASSRVSTPCSRFYSVLLSGGEICASDRVLTESADITSVRISLLPLFCAGCHFYWKFCQKTETDSVQAYHVTGKK